MKFKKKLGPVYFFLAKFCPFGQRNWIIFLKLCFPSVNLTNFAIFSEFCQIFNIKKMKKKSWDLVITRKNCCKIEFLLSMLEYVRVWHITWCQVLCVVLPHGKLQSSIRSHPLVRLRGLTIHPPHVVYRRSPIYHNHLANLRKNDLTSPFLSFVGQHGGGMLFFFHSQSEVTPSLFLHYYIFLPIHSNFVLWT
jgi:hypothetical protein